jgi:hypothetical protein
MIREGKLCRFSVGQPLGHWWLVLAAERQATSSFIMTHEFAHHESGTADLEQQVPCQGPCAFRNLQHSVVYSVDSESSLLSD